MLPTQVDRAELLLDRAETRLVDMHRIVVDRDEDELTADEQREVRRLARLAKRDITAARKVIANV